jgi:hypothetical protein
MRAGTFVRFFLAAAGVAIFAGTSVGTAAAEHRDSRRDSGYQDENVFPKATYPRGDHWSHGRHGGGHRNHGSAGSIVAVPIIVVPSVVYQSPYPYYVQQPYPQQPYPAYRYVPALAPTYYGR